MNFAIAADDRIEIKEREEINKYINLARGQRMLWKIKVMIILIVVDALGLVPKGLERELEELEIRRIIRTLQTTEILRLARIPSKVLKTGCHLNSRE